MLARRAGPRQTISVRRAVAWASAWEASALLLALLHRPPVPLPVLLVECLVEATDHEGGG